MSELPQIWQHLIAWVSSHGVAPILSALAWQDLGSPDEIAEAVVIAVLQLGIIALIFRPLESLAPAERWEDRHLTRVDIQYTLIMLLGLFPLFSYLVLTPLSSYLGGSVSSEESPLHITHWLPVLEAHPLLRFMLYYVVYDFTYYWLHRAQHTIPWWWAMHSMHHSQRQLSCWSNDRGCYPDGALQSFILAGVGIGMGVAPNEFALLVLLSELVQNFSHTNVRIGFGRFLEKIFVDPRFHRLHHMQVDPTRPGLHNCNFGQVLSVWDTLFGTALFGEPVRPTGVSDPMIDADNGHGLIVQQWETLKRFWGAFRRPAGWRPGDVSFGLNYEPIPSTHLGLPTASRSGEEAVTDA
jgi:sterol desaturase/sphingolipid hydroxylase (fatty acid hydroxylase superfamily)